MKGALKRFFIIPLAMLLASAALLTGSRGVEKKVRKDFQSQDAGIVLVTFGGMNVKCVAVDPKNPGVVYAGVYGKGLYKSSDYGTSWMQVNGGSIDQIVVDPTNSQTLYVVRGKEIMKSIDGGASWFMVCKGVDNLAMDPKNPAVVYAMSGWTLACLFKSMDGGITWQNVFTINEGNRCRAWGLLIDPYNTDTVGFFYTWGWYDTPGYWDPVSSKFVKSVDGGLHWSEIFTAPYIYDNFGRYFFGSWAWAVLNPCDSSVIYQTILNGFGASYDGGYSWFRIADLSVKKLAVHPHECRRLYASAGSCLYMRFCCKTLYRRGE